jgi:hypothetical protein
MHGNNVSLNTTGVGGGGQFRSNLTNYVGGNSGGDGTPIPQEGPH